MRMNIDHRSALIGAILSIFIVAAAIGFFSWYFRAPDIPAGVTVTANPAPEIKHEAPTVTIKPQAIKVYRPAVKRRLKLPETIIADENQHVIASSETANDEHPHTITTTIDAQTGDVQTFDRTDPLPWAAVNTKSEIGIYYGMKHGEQAVRIEGRQELLQVKALHLGAIASADMVRGSTDTFVGFGAWARW
jgi:hypothetical protein